MHFKDAYTCNEEYIIERAVTISSAEFDYICKHLLEDNRYVKDNLDVMYCDENNKLHCLLMINVQDTIRISRMLGRLLFLTNILC